MHRLSGHHAETKFNKKHAADSNLTRVPPLHCIKDKINYRLVLVNRENH
jgi:hypothetical protein